MIGAFIEALFKAPLDIVFSIKWVLAYISIRLYNVCHGKRFALYDGNAKGDPVKLGFIVPQVEKELESPFPESHLREETDEVVFYGVNSKSEYLLVRIARYCNQVAEAWICLKMANGKTYQLTERLGYQQPFVNKCTTFSCGQLQMHYLLAMRRWRIFYCGMLNETSSEERDNGKSVFVKFVFLWNASSDVYDLRLDSNPEGFASAMAKTKWRIPFVPPVNECSDALNFYAQTGAILGTISVDDDPEYEMYLFGEKMRNIGKTENVIGGKFTNILGTIPENGTALHLIKASAPHLFNSLPVGFVRQPYGFLDIIRDLDINIGTHEQKNSNNIFSASFVTRAKYDVSGKIVGQPITLYSDGSENALTKAYFVELEFQNKKGYGFILSGTVHKKPKKTPVPSENISFPQIVPLTVKFEDELSHLERITGGKGSSLGRLTELSSLLKTFQVPRGLVVTTEAYSEFLTADIEKEIKNLENIAYGNTEGDLKAACLQTASVIEKALLPTKVCQNIMKCLTDMFGTEVNNYKFAIRSSAIGEDSAAMSAAGQMETFLGVQGLKEIFIAVKKCWASQFGFIAIEYKRRYGQILNSPMAVVIQEMVPCETSGVLFTCDPVTNNPSFITITANYGLGETVVSGSVEPDTIVLRRKADEEVEIHDVIIGTKLQRIIMKDSGGTAIEDVAENSRNESCLPNETALRLASLAIKIENYYKSPRDIEWGVVDNNIYILQSRPITNAACETEYEIKHEFDTPLRSEIDYVTTANVQEAMPGAASPLGIDLVMKIFGVTFYRQLKGMGEPNNIFRCKYFFSGMRTFCNQLMISLIEMITRYDLDSNLSKGMMMSMFGRILDDPELTSFVRERSTGPPPATILNTLRYFRDLFFHTRGADQAKKEVENYHLKFLKCKKASETFAELLNSCDDSSPYMLRHIISSGVSSEWNMHLFSTLCKAKGNLDSDVYSDFARLLATSSNVESANVPHAMQELAYQITEDIGSEKFKAMSAEEAEKWLKTSESSAGRKFRIFLKRHGHRCIKEFDMMSITWEMEPTTLIKLLQSLVGVGKKAIKDKDDDNKVLTQLHTPLSFTYRMALKFILPNCRKGIRAREASKAIATKCMDYWRKGFRHLGKQMVSEGRIPELDLIFFLTLDEIEELLKTRSPSIISRANYRKKMFPTLNSYKFPEIMRGLPKPINEEEDSEDTSEFVADLTMKGVPVSQGVAKGIARVAISIEEAVHLKPGEILITHSTDIAWSPYFPVISGVVTEIGGLISHGAVVSREYGLPCVVGVKGATKKFRTGDYVLLDGKKGILQRLPLPQT